MKVKSVPSILLLWVCFFALVSYNIQMSGGWAMVVETKQDARSIVQEITAPWKGKHGGVIPILQETQKRIGYLSREAMEAI